LLKKALFIVMELRNSARAVLARVTLTVEWNAAFISGLSVSVLVVQQLKLPMILEVISTFLIAKSTKASKPRSGTGEPSEEKSSSVNEEKNTC
jgi:hypothetical protein